MTAYAPIHVAIETAPQAGTIARLPSAFDLTANGVDDWKLHDALAKLAEARDLIEQQQERIAYLESLTMTDELTGLLNRRGFYSHLRRELAAARRKAAGGVMVMIDLDGFKAVNDVHGHAAGDAYLRQVARFLQSQVRAQDVVARLGGDEFAILLTATDAAAGTARAAQLAAAAERERVEWGGAALPVRFSLGLHAYAAEDREDEVIRQADARMYRAKGERRRSRRGRRAA
ncbi:GGDEF domain-containing protein [Azospirillum sp. ST 5-10]|uniref:GGDEF domain-containing protein n=1 Tax=unclassified Azospirillum TaxID=2630922 RepID=UPI003F4A4860